MSITSLSLPGHRKIEVHVVYWDDDNTSDSSPPDGAFVLSAVSVQIECELQDIHQLGAMPSVVQQIPMGYTINASGPSISQVSSQAEYLQLLHIQNWTLRKAWPYGGG